MPIFGGAYIHLTPVPPRLAAKIQQLEFVDMAELLRDNLEVQRRATSQGQQRPTEGNPRSTQLGLVFWGVRSSAD